MNILEWCEKMNGEYTKEIKKEVDGKVETSVETHKGNLRLVFDGGNDNGGITLECEHPDFDPYCDFANVIVDQAERILDYGSWAGNFTVSNQEIFYDSDEKTFTGEYHEQSDSDENFINNDDFIEIPKEDLVFDAIRYSIDDSYDYFEVYIRLLYENGFPHPNNDYIAREIGDRFYDVIEENLNKANRDLEGEHSVGYAEGTLHSLRIEYTENTAKIFIGDIYLGGNVEKACYFSFDLIEYYEDTIQPSEPENDENLRIQE